jgi:hypothetical protein
MLLLLSILIDIQVVVAFRTLIVLLVSIEDLSLLLQLEEVHMHMELLEQLLLTVDFPMAMAHILERSLLMEQCLQRLLVTLL